MANQPYLSADAACDEPWDREMPSDSQQSSHPSGDGRGARPRGRLTPPPKRGDHFWLRLVVGLLLGFTLLWANCYFPDLSLHPHSRTRLSLLHWHLAGNV